MASGEHPELTEHWTGTSLLYLPELETTTSKTERKISSPLAHEALLKAGNRKHYLLGTDQYLYCSGSGDLHWHPAPVILGTGIRLKTVLAAKPLQLNSPMWINQTCPTNRPAAKGLALPLQPGPPGICGTCPVYSKPNVSIPNLEYATEYLQGQHQSWRKCSHLQLSFSSPTAPHLMDGFTLNPTTCSNSHR